MPEVQTALLWLNQAETLAHEVAHAWDDSARTPAATAGRPTRTIAPSATRNGRRGSGRPGTRPPTSSTPTLSGHASMTSGSSATSASGSRWAGWPRTWIEATGASIWGCTTCAQPGTTATRRTLRTELAKEYHFVDDFEPARQILELVLAEDPAHRDATILMGDIAVHEQDWDRALQWTDRALRLAPDDLAAHQDRLDALIGAGRWADAAAAASRALAVEVPHDEPIRAGLGLERARCLIELGDFSGADLDLDVLIDGGVLRRAAAARGPRADSLLRQGRWQEARTESLDALAAGVPIWPAALLTAVAWEAAAQLGETGSAPVPTEFHVDLLRWHGRDAWVDRLVAMGMEPRSNKRTRRQAALQRRRMGHLTRL